jgi:hypothetical protein
MTYVTNQMRKELSNHRLRRIQKGEITAFYLEDPKQGRMMSTLILFTPEGIALMGDLTPGRHAAVSSFGYDRRWFANKSSEDYLCEKFLDRKYLPDKAVKELLDPDGGWRDWDIGSIDEDDQKPTRYMERLQSLDEIADDCLNHDYEWLDEQLSDIGFEVDEPVGWGYDQNEAGWLCAIQQRFRELYWDIKAGVTK